MTKTTTFESDLLKTNKDIASHQVTKFSVYRQTDQFRFLGNCLPTPPLIQHFALSKRLVLMLT